MSIGSCIFSPSLKAGKGNRRDNRVHLRTLAKSWDQRSYLLRFQVIRIVIAITQDISAQHDAPLAFRAKPSPRVFRYISISVSECSDRTVYRTPS